MIDSEQNVMNNQILCFLLLKLHRFNPLNLTKFQIRENGEGLFGFCFLQLIIMKKRGDLIHILEV